MLWRRSGCPLLTFLTPAHTHAQTQIRWRCRCIKDKPPPTTLKHDPTLRWAAVFSSVLQIVLNRTVVSYFRTVVNHAFPRGGDPLMFLVVLSTSLFNLRHRELPWQLLTLNLNLFSSHTSLNVSARVTRIEFHPMIPWYSHLLSCFSPRVSWWQNWHTERFKKKKECRRVFYIFTGTLSHPVSLLSAGVTFCFIHFFKFYVALKIIYLYQQNRILQHKTLL